MEESWSSYSTSSSYNNTSPTPTRNLSSSQNLSSQNLTSSYDLTDSEGTSINKKLIIRIEVEDYEELKSSRIVTLKLERNNKVKDVLVQIANKNNVGM